MTTMRGKESTRVHNCKEDNGGNQTWLKWCRLCAKPEEDDSQESNSVLIKDEAGKFDSELVTSIGKYFWVNIKAEDEISHSLCLECKQLIDELISFTEHVNKVQTLFCLLQNMKPFTSDQAKKLRTQCGLIDEGFQHIIKQKTTSHLEIHKPLLIDQQVQTDMILLGKNNKKIHNSITESEEEHTIEIFAKSDKNVEELYEGQSDMEAEYILQGENDLEFLDCADYIEENANHKTKVSSEEEKDLGTYETVHTEQVEEANMQVCCEDEEEIEDKEEQVQDSDLFKELEYKREDEDDAETEPKSKRYKVTTKGEKVEVEVQDIALEQPDELEESVELLEEAEGDEDDDEDDYINTNEEENEKAKALLLYKGKRGRPCLKNKNDKNSANYRYECKDCKRKYKNPNIYRKHMKSIHNVVIEDLPDFMCSVCNKNCFTESRLKLHMRHHLPDEEKLTVPCPYCDRKFSQVGTMRQHVNGIHHQMKPYICDQCGRACKTMAALTEHKLVHTDECPFECEVCHKRFKNKARLKSHFDIHTQFVYKCPDCGLKLNTKRTLLQHRLVHSEEKRFKCQFCEAAFKRSKALKNHLILHTGLRPYKCNFCGRTFSNGSNCRAHKRRAHPKELAEEEATGKIAEHVAIPKLEELKSANGILVQPRKIKRHSGGLPDHLRKLLQAAEKRKKPNESNETNESENLNVENLESLEDYQYDLDESEIDETEDMADNPNEEECEETVIYEIIEEI